MHCMIKERNFHKFMEYVYEQEYRYTYIIL